MIAILFEFAPEISTEPIDSDNHHQDHEHDRADLAVLQDAQRAYQFESDAAGADHAYDG
jgi:hypothetical protein